MNSPIGMGFFSNYASTPMAAFLGEILQFSIRLTYYLCLPPLKAGHRARLSPLPLGKLHRYLSERDTPSRIICGFSGVPQNFEIFPESLI